MAADPDLMTPPCSHPSDDLSAAPASDASTADTPDHFDNGPLPEDEAAGASGPAADAYKYRYEYPEKPYACREVPEETAENEGSAEEGTTATDSREESIASMPGGEAATGDEPTTEEPTANQEMTTDDSTADDSTADDSTTDDPTTDDSTTDDSTTDDTTTEEAATDEPPSEEPSMEESDTTDEPTSDESSMEESDTADEPASEESAMEEESDTTDEPASEESAMEESDTTDEPTSEESAMEESDTTDEPTSEESAMEESDTDDSATEEMATDESSTEESATEEPGAEDAATEETATDSAPVEQPTSEEPSAEQPATEPPCEPPPCEPPTAQEPAAQEPAGEEPTMQEPTMEEPTAQEPAAQEPAVEEPTMQEPTMEEPAAQEPTTQEPTVEEPAVEEPTGCPSEQELESGYRFKQRYYGERGEYEDHDYYGGDVPAGIAAQEAASAPAESGLELFRWGPDELLAAQDQKLLRVLETLCEEPSAKRRTTLNNYLQGLGMEAVAFSRRFEEVTGIEVAGLADDLPGAAALLGSYRLTERGELGIEEAVDLLRRSLKNLSPDWIEGVRTLTAGAYEDAYGEPSTPVGDESEAGPTTLDGQSLLNALGDLVLGSLRSVGRAAWSTSASLTETDWLRLIYASMEGKTANQGGVDRF